MQSTRTSLPLLEVLRVLRLVRIFTLISIYKTSFNLIFSTFSDSFTTLNTIVFLILLTGIILSALMFAAEAETLDPVTQVRHALAISALVLACCEWIGPASHIHCVRHACMLSAATSCCGTVSCKVWTALKQEATCDTYCSCTWALRRTPAPWICQLHLFRARKKPGQWKQ